tara:strand:- start:488 stop:1144 length:657 start_codon:yes stop_codon:yes gene_type:complete
MDILTPEGFAAKIDVSRETLDKLSIYLDLLIKWQKSINLVGSKTLADAWRRHVLDSAQLFSHISKSTDLIFDLGSGAGFPGLVLAIMGAKNVVLMESNQKKCSFLGEVIRRTACSATVFNGRIEDYPEQNTGHYITARALAPLEELCAWSYPLLVPEGKSLFLKGENYEQELTLCQKKWNMEVQIHPSLIELDKIGGGEKDVLPGILIEIGKLSPRDG